ncbi:MAG TPA: hypothetical protein VNU95_10395, partial [Candidatus Acidoferrales bacterium]|nr:hypothetical protein [Candidatus Acidoferrales bacterium]
MKTTGFQKTGFILGAVFAMTMAVTSTFGQATPAPTPMYNDIPSSSAPPAPATTIPSLSPAAQQVLQLSQAKISDGTIITFVQNSGSMYGLDASQIVYMKQQGVSENVINAMLNQRTALAASQPAPAPPDNSQAAAAAPPTVITQPTTPAPSVVVVPDTQTYYYDNWASPYYYPYPYYYGGPVYWGWGGGYYGGFRGGFHGGFGGGGFRGGGGGFHGG